MRATIFMLLIACGFLQAFSQVRITKAMIDRRHREMDSQSNPYRRRDKSLIEAVNGLSYDSVKVYSFNCGPVVHPPNIAFIIVEKRNIPPEYLIDSAQHWNPTLSDTGKMVSKVDIQYIKSILKRSYTDKYWDDPSGCYEPRIGVMFFSNGIVVAHIDVCLQCGHAVFEKFSDGKVSFAYDWVTLGLRMRKFFTAVCLKYKTHCCTLYPEEIFKR